MGSLALTAGGLLTTGRASAEPHKRAFATSYVGRVEGSNAYIAILRDGRKVGGYVCNDGPGGEWIRYSSLKHGSAPLRSGAGKLVGRVTITGDRATGTVKVAGEEHQFTATR